MLSFGYQLACARELPLYFWNQGYCQLRKVDDSLKLSESDYICTSGLDWLLNNHDVRGIFVFEGVISPDTVTGIFAQSTKIMLSNLAYELTANSVPRFLLCLESYVELPVELAPLVPVLINPLPNAIAIQNFVNNCCDRKDWLRLLRETKLLTPAEIALMVRKTAENAFYRNTQECSGEGLGEKPLTVTMKDFWKCDRTSLLA